MDRSSEKRAERQPSQDSWTEAMRGEAELLGSLPGTIAQGFNKRLQQAVEHPGLTALEIAGSTAVGAVAGVMAGRGGMAGALLGVAAKGLWMTAKLDACRRLGAPLLDEWNHSDRLEADKKKLGYNIGSALFDYPLLALSGSAGRIAGCGRASLSSRLMTKELARDELLDKATSTAFHHTGNDIPRFGPELGHVRSSTAVPNSLYLYLRELRTGSSLANHPANMSLRDVCAPIPSTWQSLRSFDECTGIKLDPEQLRKLTEELTKIQLGLH